MGALRNMNTGAYEIAKEKFTELLLGGAFPKVMYKKTEMGHSYEMMTYSTVWSTFTKLIQNALVESYEFGLWQNARNKVYLAKVSEVTSGITEQQVNESSDRFRTMFD